MFPNGMERLRHQKIKTKHQQRKKNQGKNKQIKMGNNRQEGVLCLIVSWAIIERQGKV